MSESFVSSTLLCSQRLSALPLHAPYGLPTCFSDRGSVAPLPLPIAVRDVAPLAILLNAGIIAQIWISEDGVVSGVADTIVPRTPNCLASSAQLPLDGFLPWFNAQITDLKPDLIVGIARSAIRLLQLYAQDSIRKIPLLSQYALPFLPDDELAGKTYWYLMILSCSEASCRGYAEMRN